MPSRPDVVALDTGDDIRPEMMDTHRMAERFQTGHPLDDLLARWTVHRDLRVPNPQWADRFRNWLPECGLKDTMRLAWSLGIERDMRRLGSFWRADRSHVGRIADAIGNDVSSIPASVWMSFFIDVTGRLAKDTFAPLDGTVSPADGPLIHFTWNPAALFSEGFHGTTDRSALSSTFMCPKTERGYNFAFEAAGFDAANFGSDDFYGEDAVIFRAPHLRTVNLDTNDEEVIFWGGDVDPAAMVHLRREDGLHTDWSVIDNTGGIAFTGGTVERCVAWLVENERRMADRLYAPRDYEMRSVDFAADAMAPA